MASSLRANRSQPAQYLNFLVVVWFSWLFCLTAALPSSSTDIHRSPCLVPVGAVRTQQNFNCTLYTGLWHLVADYNVEGKAFFSVVQPADIRARFSTDSQGQLQVSTGARLSVLGSEWMSYCFSGTGTGQLGDPAQPAKFQLSYHTALPWSPASWAKPYWVLATDYHYALIYSCWHTLEDGTCNPDFTFAWVLSRRRRGPSHRQWRAIHLAARSACINPRGFHNRDTSNICSSI